MRRFGFAGLALSLVVLAACSTDPITPSDGRLPGSVVTPPPQALNEPTACAADDIEAHLTALMGVLVPNDNSTLGKFQYVQTLIGYNNPDSTAKARAFAQDPLISFINLKYSQASPADQAAQADEFEQVKAEILCFVGLFNIPRGNTPKVVVTSNQLMGIWFPEGFCPEDTCSGINVALDVLTACTSPGVPTGCTPAPFGTLLDLYGNYLKVTLSGDTQNRNQNLDAIVGICAPTGTEGIVDQLRVLHQDDGTTNTAGLTILDGVAIPTELDNLLLCDSWLGANNNIQESVPRSMFARMVNHLADLLLPEKVAATRMMLGGLGIGGTTRTFSPFVLAGTTLSATGIGGTKTTFSPANPDAQVSAPALTADPNATLADSVDHKQTSGLPGVYVKTGLGTGIPGATVTFTMTNPVTDPYKNTISNASVCDGSGTTQTQIVATTDATGFAALGCVNFGNTVGFKNLQATINPATATGVAGAGISEVTVTSCDPTCGTPGSSTTLNWLVQTTPGNAAKLTLNQSSWSAAAGAALSPPPVVTVRDRLNNVITTSSAVVTATATAPSGGTGGLIGTTTATASNGIATFGTPTGLGIGGTVGSWGLSFGSGTLTPATASITITAGTASQILTYLPLVNPSAAATYTYTTGLTPGATVTPAPRVIVRDGYNNPVSGVALLWSPLTAANGAVLNNTSGGTTGADGTAQVTSWTLGDGLNQVFANIGALPEGTPATFSATTPTGQSIFACTIGTSKQDLVPFSVKRPTNSATKEVTLWMSVTGQSSYSAGYTAALQVFETAAAFQGAAGTSPIATKTGTITLPGNNGNPTPVTFSFASSIPKGSGLLYFKLSVTAPGTRKFQLWYASSGFANNSDCANALMYPSYSALTPTIKGLRIQLTN